MNDEGIAEGQGSRSKHNSIYTCLMQVKHQLTTMSESERQELINSKLSLEKLNDRLEEVKLSDRQYSQNSNFHSNRRSLKASESADDFDNDRKLSNDSSQTESYDIVVRCADEELAKAQEELKDSPENANRLIVYKKALKNACDQNDFLRSEIVASRTKAAKLEIENANMNVAIIELAESIDFMTEGGLHKATW